MPGGKGPDIRPQNHPRSEPPDYTDEMRDNDEWFKGKDDEGGVLQVWHGDEAKSAIQKGTRVLISLWDSLMFGRVLK